MFEYPLTHHYGEEFLNNLQSFLPNHQWLIYHDALNDFFNSTNAQKIYTEAELASFLMSIKKPKDVESYISTIKGFFLWLYQSEKIAENPAKNLKIPTVAKKES